MKNKVLVSEISLSVLLLALVSLCLEPVQVVWMPTMMANLVLLLVIVVFIAFAVFVWKEKVLDERAQLHRLTADRFGFLAGSGVLVLGVLWQTWHHASIDWLLGALVVMVLSKLAALLYQEIHG
mgnify:FL=1